MIWKYNFLSLLERFPMSIFFLKLHLLFSLNNIAVHSSDEYRRDPTNKE
jgi:hypothetical protein